MAVNNYSTALPEPHSSLCFDPSFSIMNNGCPIGDGRFFMVSFVSRYCMELIEKLFEGLTHFGWQQAVMIVVGLVLISLAIFRKYEPMLLFQRASLCILCPLPLATVGFTTCLGQVSFSAWPTSPAFATELFPLPFPSSVGSDSRLLALLKQRFIDILRERPLTGPYIYRRCLLAANRGGNIHFYA